MQREESGCFIEAVQGSLSEEVTFKLRSGENIPGRGRSVSKGTSGKELGMLEEPEAG